MRWQYKLDQAFVKDVTMQFSKDLCVGNRIIDSEHKMLLNMINVIASSIAARKVGVLSKAFELLENSLCAYFVVEESIAQALDFDFSQHTFAHQNLLNKLKRTKDGLMMKNGMWSKSEEEDFICFMKDCLVRHIKEDSKSFKAVLDTQYYDFRPNWVEGAPSCMCV